MPVYAQLLYFGFECLSGNAQLKGGAGWPPDHAFGFPESGFQDLSFVLNKVSNQRSGRRSQFGSHVREPSLIYKESLPSDRITARSTTFCNSRMLPGQSYAWKSSMVFLSMFRIFLPNFLA